MSANHKSIVNSIFTLILVLTALFIGRFFLNINYILTAMGLFGLLGLWYIKYYPPKPNSLIKGVFSFFASSWWVFLTIGIFKIFLFEQYLIPSESMYPTYRVGDYVIARKFDIPVAKGNVLIFQNPYNSQESYIKRVIALSGDRIYIEGNHIMINGKSLVMEDLNQEHVVSLSKMQTKVREYTESNGKATYPVWLGAMGKEETLQAKDKPCAFKQGIVECVVPKDHVFMMGDNRRFSYDSRYMGAIHQKYIQGIVIKHWTNELKTVPIYK